MTPARIVAVMILLAVSIGVVDSAQRASPNLLLTSSPPSSVQAFDLLDSFIGLDATLGGVSPDIALAAGWEHLVLARNSGLALFRKGAGSEVPQRLAQSGMTDFLAAITETGDQLTDPYVIFDPEGGRFFFVLAQMNTPMALMLAVSKSAYPTTLTGSDWFFYRVARNEDADEADFDKLAVAGDTLLVGWQRTVVGPSGPVGAGSRIRLFDKRQLMNGSSPTNPIDLPTVSTQNYRPRPAAVATARDRQAERSRVFYDLYRVCGSTNRETWLLGAVTGIGGTARFDTREVASPFPCDNTPVTAPQPGSAIPIRFGHLATTPVYHDGHLWLFEPGGGTTPGTVISIQWMEIDVRGWPDVVSVVQSGTFTDPGGASVYVPSATVDWAGNVAFTYLRSSATEYPSTYYAGRLATDPPGTMRAGQPLRSGTRSWGYDRPLIDFSTTVVDPADGSVWVGGLIPTPVPVVVGTRPEYSDVWIGRMRLLAGAAFSDPVLSRGVSPIKAIHVTELRTRIDLLRQLRGLPGFAWTDPSLGAGTTTIRLQHILDLRVALAEVDAAAGLTPLTYTDPDLAAGTPIKWVHIAEIRAAVVTVE